MRKKCYFCDHTLKMTYQEILDNIFTALPMYHRIGNSAYKEGLENIEALVSVVGDSIKTQNFASQLHCIHVAGTNGKGSVTHLLSSFYQEKGLKVGLYTSPHLIDFRERIKINGEMIPEEKVVEFFERFNEQFKSIEPSFFEMTTALAFYYFAEEKVDIAIIEVGLGGRLDATNIIRPQTCVITNITLEHTQLLGDTLAKIAFEKAGIMKENTPVVIGNYNNETMPVFQKRAHELNAPLFTTDGISISESTISDNPHYRLINIKCGNEIIGENVRLPLQGDYQFENIATFVKTISVSTRQDGNRNALICKAIENVVTNTHLMGRWQILSEKPLAVCDTGHNSGGFQYLAKQMGRITCRKLHVIIGFVSDKDVDSIIRLLPRAAEYIVCHASVDRAMASETIFEKMKAAGLEARISSESVADTYQTLLREISADDAVYVGGSTFIVADLLKDSIIRRDIFSE